MKMCLRMRKGRERKTIHNEDGGVGGRGKHAFLRGENYVEEKGIHDEEEGTKCVEGNRNTCLLEDEKKEERRRGKMC